IIGKICSSYFYWIFLQKCSVIYFYKINICQLIALLHQLLSFFFSGSNSGGNIGKKLSCHHSVLNSFSGFHPLVVSLKIATILKISDLFFNFLQSEVSFFVKILLILRKHRIELQLAIEEIIGHLQSHFFKLLFDKFALHHHLPRLLF